jgi:hypothetical protein
MRPAVAPESPNERPGSVGLGQPAHDTVEPAVHLVPGWVLVVPGDDLARALLEGDGGQVVGTVAAVRYPAIPTGR